MISRLIGRIIFHIETNQERRERDMRYPAFITDGDAIGFPAPSFGCTTEPYRTAFGHAQEVLKAKGYRTVIGSNAYADDGIGISSTPENCGREITDMMLSGETEALISCGGGEMMCEILPYVDFERIRKAKPKWFMGYSDNTNLTFLLPILCDTAAIYGPCAGSFGMEPWHEAIHDAYQLLRGEKLESVGYAAYEINPDKDADHPLEPYACTEARKIVAFAPRKGMTSADREETITMSGRLIGGCMDILATLCGTAFDRVRTFEEKYREDGLIWFLEACDLSVFGIRRAVWQMKNAGWFETTKGFLIGRPWAGQADSMGLDHIRAVTDVLAELEVPILLDVDIGHLPPMMPLVSGSMAEVRYTPSSDRFHLKMELR